MKQTSDAAGAAATSAPIQSIRVTDIVPDPANRKDHDPAKLQLLADEIKVDGLLQPVVVRPVYVDGKPLPEGKYQLIAGERRWRAVQLLGWTEIDARVRLTVDEKSATRMRLAENFHREDLTPIEKARDLEQLFTDGATQAEVAAFVGAKDQSTISNMMRLLKLPKLVQDWLQDGTLNAAQGKALLRFEGRNKLVEKIATLAIKAGTSSKQLEKGLPFKDELVRAGLVTDLGWRCRVLNELPAQWRLDGDFIEGENEWQEVTVCCLDPNKGKLVAKQIEDAAKAKEAADAKRRQGKTGAAGGGGLSAAELAERKRTIEANKAKRAAIEATYEVALAHVKGCLGDSEHVYVHDLERVVRVVVDATLEDYRHGKRMAEAAKALGLKATSEKDFAKLRPEDQLCVAATAVLLRHCEDAKRNAWGVPDEAVTLAGREVKPPAAPKKPAAKKVDPKLEKTVMAAVAKVQGKPAKKSKRAVINDEVRSEVRRLVESGRTGAEIVKAIGISLPSVQNIKKALGLVAHRKGGR